MESDFNNNINNSGFSPVSEPQRGKSKKGLFIGIGAVAAAVCAAGVAVYNSGMFPKAMISPIIENTVKPDRFMETIQMTSDTMKAYTFDISGEYQGQSISLEYSMDTAAKALSLDADVKISGTNLNGTLASDGQTVKLQIPQIMGSDSFFFDTTKENDGFIVSLLENQGIDLSKSNTYLNGAESDYSVVYERLSVAWKNTLNKLEYEKAEKKEFTVDGVTSECQGYKYAYNTDVVNMFIDEIVSAFSGYEETADAYLSAVANLSRDTDSPKSFNEAISKLRESAKEAHNMDISFYVYKNALSGIVINDKDENKVREIDFLGGNVRMDNFKVISDGKTVFEKKGKTEGTQETAEYFVEDMQIFKRSYDYSNGDLKFSSDGFELNGKIEKQDGGFKLDVNSVKIGDEELDVNGVISLKKGATIKTVDESGEKYDVGTMKKDDFVKLYSKWDLSALSALMG